MVLKSLLPIRKKVAPDSSIDLEIGQDSESLDMSGHITLRCDSINHNEPTFFSLADSKAQVLVSRSVSLVSRSVSLESKEMKNLSRKQPKSFSFDENLDPIQERDMSASILNSIIDREFGRLYNTFLQFTPVELKCVGVQKEFDEFKRLDFNIIPWYVIVMTMM